MPICDSARLTSNGEGVRISPFLVEKRMGYLLSRLIGEMTLWKAIVMCSLIAVVVGGSMCSRRRPVDSGTLSLQPGEMGGSGIF